MHKYYFTFVEMPQYKYKKFDACISYFICQIHTYLFLSY